MHKVKNKILKEKKSILIFIDWFTPGYKAGGPVSSIVNLVSSLSDLYQFYILTSNCEYLENEPYTNIESNKWVHFDTNIKVFYAEKAQISVKLIKNALQQIDFDIAYVNGIYSFYFSILPLYLLKNTNKKLIVAARGMLSAQAFTAKSFKKKLFLKIIKHSRLYKNCIFQATTAYEAGEIKRLNLGMKDIVVIPNLPKKIENTAREQNTKNTGMLNLVNIARISKEKNTKYALEILVFTKYSGKINFDIYGSVYDKWYWNECLEIIDKLPENIQVNYCNTIESENVIATFAKYHFSFMPSKGENFGHSILESLISGTPVIISKNTPWQNLPECNAGWDIDLNEKETFCKTIQSCINMSDAEYKAMVISAKQYASQIIEKSGTQEKIIALFG